MTTQKEKNRASLTLFDLDNDELRRMIRTHFSPEDFITMPAENTQELDSERRNKND